MRASVVSRAAGLGALTAAGQLIVVFSLPAYSKVFDPATYGEYIIFVGTVGVVAVLAGLRYDSAIVLPRNDRMASALSNLVMLIALAVAALVAVGTLLAQSFAWAPGKWLRLERYFGYGLAVATVLGGLQRCLTSWCVRGGRFFLMGFGQFALALVTVASQLSFTAIMNQEAALIWGYVCALDVKRHVWYRY